MHKHTLLELKKKFKAAARKSGKLAIFHKYGHMDKIMNTEEKLSKLIDCIYETIPEIQDPDEIRDLQIMAEQAEVIKRHLRRNFIERTDSHLLNQEQRDVLHERISNSELGQRLREWEEGHQLQELTFCALQKWKKHAFEKAGMLCIFHEKGHVLVAFVLLHELKHLIKALELKYNSVVNPDKKRELDIMCEHVRIVKEHLAQNVLRGKFLDRVRASSPLRNRISPLLNRGSSPLRDRDQLSNHIPSPIRDRTSSPLSNRTVSPRRATTGVMSPSRLRSGTLSPNRRPISPSRVSSLSNLSQSPSRRPISPSRSLSNSIIPHRPVSSPTVPSLPSAPPSRIPSILPPPRSSIIPPRPPVL